MKRLLPPLLVLLAAAQLRAAIEVGSSIEEVLNELGDPRIRLVLGSQEELTFTNKVRILVVNGKIVEIHNKAALQAKGATPATPPSSAAPPATKTVRASTPEDTSPVNVAALKVEGKVTYKGKTIPLKSACGQWRNKNSNLCLWIFPFELTPEEAGMFKSESNLDSGRRNQIKPGSRSLELGTLHQARRLLCARDHRLQPGNHDQSDSCLPGL